MEVFVYFFLSIIPLSSSETFFNEEKNILQDVIQSNQSFFCNTTDQRSKDVPDSVHKLKPGDIDIIAAMGDSLTAGFAMYATDILQLFEEGRGE
jgi:hypothetical protein